MNSSKSIDLNCENDCVACGEPIEVSETSVKLSFLEAKFMFHLSCYETYSEKAQKELDNLTSLEKDFLSMKLSQKIEELDIAKSIGYNEDVDECINLIGKYMLNVAVIKSLNKLSYCPEINEYVALKTCFKRNCQFIPACKIDITIVPPKNYSTNKI